MQNYILERDKTGLLIIDVQEKMVNQVERPCEMLLEIHKLIQGFHILKLPIVVSEQVPDKLGPTVEGIKKTLNGQTTYLSKTTFSCMDDPEIRKHLLRLPIQQWVIVGLEAHICVLQTAKALLAAGKQVTVLNDAISSRSIYDFSTAIAEMRDCGARISSTETVLFELLRDSRAPEFKQISQLVR